ncbi:MAG: hypothetical protein PHW18_09700 [Sulfuricurvum sp.]|uniref:hypothetical protein n=1 Tax=Sulfuricurvum sp. TaxID=2025608 RepID=UPI002628D63B|nr:hypothetical protein [Sulfuricurvum sp.]MDD2829833.1 hypothetical protein [Sulfuricurvum sp.]MDD4949113.1 hypothetical protein [Sulfuricurvum sp.]
MFEGIYFEFPKLSFLLFVFFACDNLCPLRASALYFPHLERFQNVGVKKPAWMWISKWVMIASLVVAGMSPIKDIEQPIKFEGYSTLIVCDSLTPQKIEQLEQWCALRPYDKIAFYLPPAIKLPLSYDHEAMLSMIRQIPYTTQSTSITYTIQSFFPTNERNWIVVFSDNPKYVIHSLPHDIENSMVPQDNWREWMKQESAIHKPLLIEPSHPMSQHFYAYPLFLGLMAMIVYLYGRNQKGLL